MARTAAVAALGLLLALAVACGGSGPDPAPARPEPAPMQAPAEEPTATQAATPAATATPASTPARQEEPRAEAEVPLEIVTLLPPDAIPAIDNPRFISAEAANGQLSRSDLVIGVSIDGRHRAYGAAFLSAHEIVNDTLGGRAIAVTW